MTPDERCARCGDLLPGANSDNLDVCVPCDTIVGLEIERDERLAEVTRLRSRIEAVESLRRDWAAASMARLHGWPISQMLADLESALHG